MRLWGWWRPRRAIFRHRVNGRWRYWDPAEVRDALDRADPKWPDLVDAANKTARPLPAGLNAPPEVAKARDDEAAAHFARLAGLVSTAFGVPPLSPDGSGASRAERIGLLAAYFDFCADLEARYASFPAAPEDTASPAGA